VPVTRSSGGSWLAEAGVEAIDLTADGVLRDAVLAGHAAAAVVVTRRGADPPWRADLPAPWAGPQTR
jgi:sugar/nucleoside kinase (ribokinase family)